MLHLFINDSNGTLTTRYWTLPLKIRSLSSSDQTGKHPLQYLNSTRKRHLRLLQFFLGLYQLRRQGDAVFLSIDAVCQARGASTREFAVLGPARDRMRQQKYNLMSNYFIFFTFSAINSLRMAAISPAINRRERWVTTTKHSNKTAQLNAARCTAGCHTRPFVSGQDL